MGSTISKVPVISWKWVKTYFLEITGFAGFTGTFCGFPGFMYTHVFVSYDQQCPNESVYCILKLSLALS